MTAKPYPGEEGEFSASWDGFEQAVAASWDSIIAHYRTNYDAGCWGEEFMPMLKLVEAIAASPYAAYLFGKCTSPLPMRHLRSQLDLFRTRTIRRRHQMLAVSFVPADDWFLFEYFEAAFEPTPWATVAARSEGFTKLEWVLHNRLRWFSPSH